MDLLELIGSDDDNDDSDESRQDDKEHRQDNRFLHGEIAIPSNNEMPLTKRQKCGSIEHCWYILDYTVVFSSYAAATFSFKPSTELQKSNDPYHRVFTIRTIALL